MTRKKVNLAWIVNDTSRRSSLKKRRASLLKKVKELTTLCGVEACIVIFSPDEAEPAMWPTPEEVTVLLLRYQDMPELEKSKKMMDQESYIKERISRVHSQLRKQQRKNKEMEINLILDQIMVHGRAVETLDMREADAIAWWAAERAKEIRKTIRFSRQQRLMATQQQQQQGGAPPPPPVVAAPPPPPPPTPGMFSPPPPLLGDATAAQNAAAFDGALPPGIQNIEQWMWDEWFDNIVEPNGTGAGSSGAGQGTGLPPPPPPQPQGGNGNNEAQPNDETFDMFKSSWPDFFSP